MEIRPLSSLSYQFHSLVRGRLWAQVLVGLIAGILLGILLGPEVELVSRRNSGLITNWLALPGNLFLVLVQMIVIPLVAVSVIRGITSVTDAGQLKSLALFSIIFFVVITAFASWMGIGLTNWLRPGDLIDPELARSVLGSQVPGNSDLQQGLISIGDFPNAVISLIPSNPLQSMVGGEMMQVIIFAVIIGVALLQMTAEKSRPLIEILASIQEVCTTVVSFAMRLAPYAVFGLICRLTSTMGIEILTGIGAYVLTTLLGMFLLLGLYLLIVLVLAKRSPTSFIADTRDVLLLAFSTSSSAAVMPLTMQVAEEKLGVRSFVARFVVPLGATANMAGTALYQGAATAFLAQVFGIELTTTAILLVVTMAVSASIGSPGAPGASVVILAAMLENIGIPAGGIALLLGVDRLLDMSRTSVNVAGDLVACVAFEGLHNKASGKRTPNSNGPAKDPI